MAPLRLTPVSNLVTTASPRVSKWSVVLMKSAYSPVSRPTTGVLNLLVKASSCSSIVPSWTRGSTAVTPGGRSHAAAVRRGEGLSVHMCPHPPDSTSRQLKTRSIPSGRRQNVRAAIYWTRGKFFCPFLPTFRVLQPSTNSVWHIICKRSNILCQYSDEPATGCAIFSSRK